jgi:8-oxo-dGTP diphosphatase
MPIVALVPAYLIRHAHAGHRSDWDGADEDRPLSAKGHREAEHLAQLLGHQPIGRVLTSPAVRCIETVTPLAKALGIDLEPNKHLAEGRDPVKAVGLAIDLAESNPALCAHGDLIPDMIRLLHRRGMKIAEDGPTKKGSFWVLEFDGEMFEKATYHSPPAAV